MEIAYVDVPEEFNKILEKYLVKVDAFLFFRILCIDWVIWHVVYRLGNYFKTLNKKLATDTKMDVALNQREVLWPMSEFLALVLLGLTYRMSFCCK